MRISVITPTWNRHRLLMERCIPSVEGQSVQVEHIIASDGPDPELAWLLRHRNVKYVEVAEHWDDPLNVGANARNRGLEVATGDLIAYLDDDNAFKPAHCEILELAMRDHPDVDFVYSMMFRHGFNDIIGAEPPVHGAVDSSTLMQRHDTHLKFGLWPCPASYSVDWDLIAGWLERGAVWMFVPTITVDYYYQGMPS